MTNAIVERTIFLIFLFAILAGTVVLQIYLSKKNSKWSGLILPIITFAFSLLAVMGMAAFVEVGTHTTSQYIDGEWVTIVISNGGERQVIPGAIGGAIYTFILMNIPTAILLGMYKAARIKHNRQREMEKMSVQDL